jgi:hypothetical protein
MCGVEQLVARLAHNQEVAGSSPVSATKLGKAKMATPEEIIDLMQRQMAEKQQQAIFQRNLQYADPLWQTKLTKLTPDQEKAFLSWVQQNRVPFNPSDKNPDYDMRGFYQALIQGDPRAATAVNQYDQAMHFPDVWKTPYHETFSQESVFAGEKAPRWEGSQLIAPTGEVLVDESIPRK